MAGDPGEIVLDAGQVPGSGFRLPPCPWLPAVDVACDFMLTRRHGGGRGPEFYLDALRYAQSQWRCGRPAQAVLQLDKAWQADLGGDGLGVLGVHPPPYQALAWILRRAADGASGYLGNPVRHFQHLASRMSGPRAIPRSWRAWVCRHLAARCLPGAGFPADGRQLAREGLWVPSPARSLGELARHGWPGEAAAAIAAFRALAGPSSGVECGHETDPTGGRRA